VEVAHDSWFDTLTVRCDGSATVIAAALVAGLSLRLVDATRRPSASTRRRPRWPLLREVLALFGRRADRHDDVAGQQVTASLAGAPTEFLTQSVFHRHPHRDRDAALPAPPGRQGLALDRTMIPLGSCTMKLNATAEMMPVTWPEFAERAPVRAARRDGGLPPDDQRAGADDGRRHRLRRGQPAAQRRQPGRVRRACWPSVPTTAAAATTAHGLPDPVQRTRHQRRQRRDGRPPVVVVACDEQGNVDLDDLRAKAEQHASSWPESWSPTRPRTACSRRHHRDLPPRARARWGQVYVDGANLNALVGWRARRFGADVSHLNLHKTFCIPHGGGGPGVGPVAVREHLAPFLPGHPLGSTDQPVGPVSARARSARQASCPSRGCTSR
jgi:glycine dehydrogenase